MLVCAFLCASLHTRPRVQRAPGLPCALLLLAGERFASLGQSLSRECGVMSRRHCEPTGRANARPMTGSAKQSRAAYGALDCFVASLLAMTTCWRCPGSEAGTTRPISRGPDRICSNTLRHHRNVKPG